MKNKLIRLPNQEFAETQRYGRRNENDGLYDSFYDAKWATEITLKCGVELDKIVLNMLYYHW